MRIIFTVCGLIRKKKHDKAQYETKENRWSEKQTSLFPADAKNHPAPDSGNIWNFFWLSDNIPEQTDGDHDIA